jgi:hypothetical protein
MSSEQGELVVLFDLHTLRIRYRVGGRKMIDTAKKLFPTAPYCEVMYIIKSGYIR